MANNTYSESINGYKVEVDYDTFADDPRRDWDNLGKWVCAHKRHSLPNEINFNFDEFYSWSEVEAALAKRFDYVIPLYMYDHSALGFNLYGYAPTWWHARWDAGRVGFVVASKSDIRAWFGVKKVTKEIEKQFINTLQSEVEVYQAYANGEVYRVDIYDEADGELIDCCGGFTSVEDALESGREVAEGYGDRQALVTAKEEHPELVSY